MENAAEYIAENYRTVTVKELAERYGYSVSHFRRLFGRKYGMSPREYIFCYKIEKAEELLLEEPARRIEEVSAMLGMYNAAHFCRIFKRRTGCSPGEYRLRSRERKQAICTGGQEME